MDFREFRSKVVRVPFAFEGEEFWVGYRPREILEEDMEQLAWLQKVRLDLNIDPALLAEQEPPPPNRAARRRADKAERVARATPATKQRQEERRAPTLIDHMTRLIADWSLTWDGEPWPVCEESFRQVEPLMRMLMIQAIMEDYLDRPNRLSSSMRSSEATTASGPTGPTSASEPSSGATTAAAPEPAPSPGTS